MSLRSFFQLIICGYKTIVFYCLSMLSIAGAFILLLPNKWEVHSIMSPPIAMAPVVDSISNLATRLRAPSTIKEVLRKLKAAKGVEISYREFRNSMRVNTVDKSVELRIELDSVELGILLSKMMLDEINFQESIFLQHLVEDRAQIKLKLMENAKEFLLISNNQVLIESAINSAIYKMLDINENAKTYFLVEPSYDPRPSSPRRMMIIFAALMIAIIAALIKIFFYDRDFFPSENNFK